MGSLYVVIGVVVLTVVVLAVIAALVSMARSDRSRRTTAFGEAPEEKESENPS